MTRKQKKKTKSKPVENVRKEETNEVQKAENDNQTDKSIEQVKKALPDDKNNEKSVKDIIKESEEKRDIARQSITKKFGKGR